MDSDVIKILLEKYLQGTLTRDEAGRLKAMLNKEEGLKAVEAELQDTFMNSVYDVPELPERGERLRLGILHQIREQASTYPVKARAKGGIPGKLRWLTYAAILMFVSASALYLVLPLKTLKPAAVFVGKAKSVEIRPAAGIASLTLSDGTTILLDSSRRGPLAQQGGTNLLTPESGVLAYRGEETVGESELLYNTLKTPKGGQYQIVLADGSKVWLNAGSSLHFPAAFAGPTRNVELAGEAYFEVAKNKGKPFIVKTGSVSVQVLGTKFNINAYDNEPYARTTLCEGSVKVSNQNAYSILNPGQQALSKEEKIEILNDVNIDQALAWKNGIFYFENADLFSVMRQVERWYNIKVIYPKDPPALKFHGKLPRDLTLSQVLKILTETDVKFTLQDRNITILPD